MPRRTTLALVALLLFASVPAVHAASTFHPKILLHLMSPTGKNACGRAGALPTCNNIVTSGDLAPATCFAYVLVTDVDPAEGLAGMQFGIRYDGAPGSGVDVFGWDHCATLNFPNGGWPASGTGNLVTWDLSSHCQQFEPGGPGTGVTAVAGYLYVSAYSPDELEIIPRPVDGAAKTANCNAAEFNVVGPVGIPAPWPLGKAAFSAGAVTPGYNPCGLIIAGAPDCNIIGPELVDPAATVTYQATSSQPGTAFLWDVRGEASIVGPITLDTVTITAGGSGYFQVVLQATSATGVGGCDLDVGISGTLPHCAIYGPDTVPVGVDTLSYFAYVTAIPPVTVQWSVTGNGELLGSDGHQAFVRATAPGAMTIEVAVTDGQGAGSSCSRTVPVTEAGCVIRGNDMAVTERVTRYSSSVTGSSYEWSITGNGTITLDLSDGSVLVVPGAPGYFTLRLTVGGNPAGPLVCDKTVEVHPLPDEPPGTQASAKLLLHLTPPVTGNACQTAAARPRCSEVNARGDLFPAVYFAYLLVADGNAAAGIVSASCGIDYDGAPHSGVDVFDWHACCDLPLAFNDWPRPGGGVSLSWSTEGSCQRNEPGGPGTGVVATGGYFYLAAYSPDTMRLTVDPFERVARIYDCDLHPSYIEGGGVHHTPSPLGYARFSAGAVEPGAVPCAAGAPVRQTTWGAIKSMFGK